MGWLVIVLPLLVLAVFATASTASMYASARKAGKLTRRGDAALLDAAHSGDIAPRQGSRVAATVTVERMSDEEWEKVKAKSFVPADPYQDGIEYVAYYQKTRYRSWPP